MHGFYQRIAKTERRKKNNNNRFGRKSLAESRRSSMRCATAIQSRERIRVAAVTRDVCRRRLFRRVARCSRRTVFARRSGRRVAKPGTNIRSSSYRPARTRSFARWRPVNLCRPTGLRCGTCLPASIPVN